jgi:hypothetical protein
VDLSKIAFVDTETLGLDARRHPIWEIAIVLDGMEFSWFQRVTTAQLLEASPRALEINHFHDRYDPSIAMDPQDSIVRFCSLVNGCHLAGAIPSFDEERLRALWVRYMRKPMAEEQPPWHYHVIDLEAMAVGALIALGVTVELPWKSHWLSEQFGVTVDPDEEHTALGDARWASRLFAAICNGVDPAWSRRP